MKHLKLLGLPFLILGLTGCSTAEQMINHINDSTATIHENREAVDSSTRAIRENRARVQESSRTIEQNYHLLKAAKEA